MCTGTIVLTVGQDNYENQSTKFYKTEAKAQEVRNALGILKKWAWAHYCKICLIPLDASAVSCPNSKKKILDGI